MTNKLTAVEWFTNEIDNLIPYVNEKTAKQFKDLVDKAKEMEKLQIINACDAGFDDGCGFIDDIKYKNAEQYYKETYEQ